jgi:hypothetical protein
MVSLNRIKHRNTAKENSNRSKKLLLISVIILSALVTIISFFPPNAEFSILNYKTSIFPVFFFFLFAFLFAFGTFLFKNIIHGILIATFTTMYLLFRLNNLVHPFFFLLLLALFIVLEFLFSYRK